MKAKDILKMVSSLRESLIQQAELHDVEMRARDASINLLGVILHRVVTVLAEDMNLNEDLREEFDETARILKSSMTTAEGMRRVSERLGFFRDQELAQIERIGQTIDQLPDE